MIYKGPGISTYWGSDEHVNRRAEVMHDEEEVEEIENETTENTTNSEDGTTLDNSQEDNNNDN